MLQIVVMIAGFILPKVMLTFYGSEINGLVSSITQFVLYLTLIEAGLSGATIYSLYKPLADNNKISINRVITAAKNFYYRIGFLFILLLIGGAILYPLFVQSDLLSSLEISLIFVVLGTNGILEFFTLAKYRALLTADQKTYVISIAGIVQTIINVIIIWSLSVSGFSIIIVRLVAIIAILVRSLILWIYCKIKYKYLDFSVEPDYSSLDKRKGALYFQIIGVVQIGSPVIIATIFLTLNDVSIYAVYYVVVGGISAILSIFTSGISAGFGDLITRGEKRSLKNAFQQFEYLYYMFITVVYSVMLFTFVPFVKIYTANADINYIYPALAILLTLNGYFYSLKTPYGMLTIAAGKYSESIFPITIQALLQIVIGSVLVLFLGLNGIIIGAIISNLYRVFEFVDFAPKHLIDYSFKDSLIMWIRSFVIFSILCIVLYFVPNNFITGYLSWLLYAIILVIISTFIVFVINAFADKNKLIGSLLRIKSIVKGK